MKRYVRHWPPSHCFAVAVTQSGKTTCFAVPTILANDEDSLVIHDPKDEGDSVPGGELYTLTAGWRAQVSKVVRFQPLSETSHQYNPLQAVRLYRPQETRDLQLIADMLTDPDGDGADGKGDAGLYFAQGASDIHLGVLTHGLYTRSATTLGDFYQLWCGNLQLADLLQTMESTRHVDGHCHPTVVRAVRVLRETADRELSALLNTTRRALRLWADPLVCRATARSDFRLRDLREGLRPLQHLQRLLVERRIAGAAHDVAGDELSLAIEREGDLGDALLAALTRLPRIAFVALERRRDAAPPGRDGGGVARLRGALGRRRRHRCERHLHGLRGRGDRRRRRAFRLRRLRLCLGRRQRHFGFGLWFELFRRLFELRHLDGLFRRGLGLDHLRPGRNVLGHRRRRGRDGRELDHDRGRGLRGGERLDPLHQGGGEAAMGHHHHGAADGPAQQIVSCLRQNGHGAGPFSKPTRATFR